MVLDLNFFFIFQTKVLYLQRNNFKGRFMRRISWIIVFLMILSFQTTVFAQDKNRKDSVLIAEIILPEMNVVNNRLYLKNAPVGKKVEVITIIGNKIREFQIKSPNEEFELTLPRAIYIFKMNGIVKKFIVK